MYEPVYYNKENDDIVTLEQLRNNWEQSFKDKYPSFYDYVDSCQDYNNGTLTCINQANRTVVAIVMKKGKYHSNNPLDIKAICLDSDINDYDIDGYVWELCKLGARFKIKDCNSFLTAEISSDGRRYFRSTNNHSFVDNLLKLYRFKEEDYRK